MQAAGLRGARSAGSVAFIVCFCFRCASLQESVSDRRLGDVSHGSAWLVTSLVRPTSDCGSGIRGPAS